MLNVGIVGLGTIGTVVAKALDNGMNGLQLSSIASGRREKAEAFLATLNTPIEIMSIEEVAESCEIVVDCAPKVVFDEIVALAFLRTLTSRSRPPKGKRGSSLRPAHYLDWTLYAQRQKAQSIQLKW